MPDKTDTLRIGTSWVKKHGNVITRLIVLDGSEPTKVLLRVTDSGGSLGYTKGREVTMDAQSLARYYAPASNDKEAGSS